MHFVAIKHLEEKYGFLLDGNFQFVFVFWGFCSVSLVAHWGARLNSLGEIVADLGPRNPKTKTTMNRGGQRKHVIRLMDKNPAPVDMVNIPLFIWFYTSQVAHDFFHQQYHLRYSSHS